MKTSALGSIVFEIAGETMKLDTTYFEAVKMREVLIRKALNKSTASDNEDYQRIREKFINDEKYKSLLPRFVIGYTNFYQFWHFIKNSVPKPDKREEYITQAFKPLLQKLSATNPYQSRQPIKEEVNKTSIYKQVRSARKLYNKDDESMIAIKLRDLLMERARGNKMSANHEYRELRERLINNSYLTMHVPYFIEDCKDLSQYWEFISKKYPSYKQRIDYLESQFEKVVRASRYLKEEAPPKAVIEKPYQKLEGNNLFLLKSMFEEYLQYNNDTHSEVLKKSKEMLVKAYLCMFDDVSGSELIDVDFYELSDRFICRSRERLSIDDRILLSNTLYGFLAILGSVNVNRSSDIDHKKVLKESVHDSITSKMIIGITTSIALFIIELFKSSNCYTLEDS